MIEFYNIVCYSEKDLSQKFNLQKIIRISLSGQQVLVSVLITAFRQSDTMSNRLEEASLTGMIRLGKLNKDFLEKEFGKILTDEIIVTEERLLHIKTRHSEDYGLFERYGSDCVVMPDLIIKDMSHDGTVIMIKRLLEINLSVIVRLFSNWIIKC